MSIPEIVHNATLYLDEFYPGWAGTIDQDNFNISNCNQCVLKYVAGTYSMGLAEYKQRVAPEVWNGAGRFPFCALGDRVASEAAWLAEINSRLEEKGSREVVAEREMVLA